MQDNDILKDFDDAYNEGITDWAQYYEEAYTDLAIYTGNQWSTADKAFLKGEHRNAYVFNNIRRMIRQVGGYQRKNRLSSVCEPIENGDQYTSDLFSDILLYIMQSSEGYNTISNSFEGALITGLNLISVWADYSTDPVNGDIKICREPFNSFMLDPQFTKLDLSDCRYLMRRRYIDKDTAKMLLPDKMKFIDEVHPASRGDDKFSYMSYSRRNAHEGKLLRYDEFWRRTTKKAYLLIDGISGQTQQWKGGKKALDLFVKQFPFVEYKPIMVPSVELNIILEDTVMYSGEDPYKLGDYPFVPVIGFYTPEYDDFQYKLQGLGRGLRDAQEELNKTRSQMSDIMKSQINSGWEIEEGQVTNIDDLYKTGQGVVIQRKRGTLPLNKIRPAELSQAFPLMVESLQRDIIQLAGGNEELLGVAEGGNTEVSGTLAKQRSSNAITTFQDLFDNLALSQKFLGEKILKMAISNWTPEKIQRITSKEVPQDITNTDITKYDVVIKESALTDTQQTLQYMQLLEAQRAGVQIPQRALIRALPIADKTELMKDFEAEQEEMKAQQQKVSQQEALALQLGNAEVVSKLSLAEERKARAKADIGLLIERTSESKQNQSEAVLNQVRSASEIIGMRQDQLVQALQFVMQLQEKATMEDERREVTSLMVAEQPQQGGQNAVGQG